MKEPSAKTGRHTRMRKLLILGMLLTVACSSAPRAPIPSDTGVEGVTQIGPTCPVQRVDEPCPDRPVRAEIRVLQDGNTVGVVRSGEDGMFRVALRPGEYIIEASLLEQNALNPDAQPVTVTVRAGEFTRITIAFDSGIR